MSSLSRWLLRFRLFLMAGFFSGALNAAVPVAFTFKVSPSAQNPFSREIWAEVVTPAKEVLKLPAFFVGKDMYCVRARADAKGQYRLGGITEVLDGQSVVLTAKVSDSRKKTVRLVEDRPAIKLDANTSSHFVFTSGGEFVPVGANLAWPVSECLAFYNKALNRFAHAGLNWARIWMVHWGALNLDWVPGGKSPPLGTLDLAIAANWDELITLAEKEGVYLQVVLQHHGQYSSRVNPNWKDNPWNAANPGGFLKTPVEFFTSPEAIKLTRMKYRYIIARWGYSPAVMAWELFNEVHWVDAMRGETKDEAAVARWHSEMATYIRSLDRYHHLITTSTEDLNSPIYAEMDYFQPHLYSPVILAAARKIDQAPRTHARPVFYGETGDDHLPLSPEVKKTGITIAPPIWASLMGQGRYPAQPWTGAQLLETNRLGELGAVARFLAATKLMQREGLVPFSSVVECTEKVPLVLQGGQFWQRRPAPEITVPLDGREAIEIADIPRIYVGSKESLDDGYSGRATFHFDFPRPATLCFHVTDTAAPSGAIRISVDGVSCVEKTWPERNPEASPNIQHYTDDIPLPISAGVHTVVVENPGAPGWFDLSRIDMGLDIPVLAATGQRGEDFLAMWVWHRDQVFAPHPSSSAQGTLLIDDVPAATWRVTWWDAIEGLPGKDTTVVHQGGTLRLTTPPISRHAAVVLTREIP
jgi:hypothetical protein